MNPKYYNFSILLILLSFFDIVTTQYALRSNPSLREGNAIMALVTGSFWLFVLVKAFGVLFIIRLYDRIKKQSVIGAKVGQVGQTVIIALMLLVVGNNIIQIGSAVDNTAYAPTCLEPSYDTGYIFQITSNNATNGDQITTDITAGYFTPNNNRIYNGTNILCVKPDHTTVGSLAGQSRLFGTSEDGSVWYTDYTLTNYSEGFFSVLYPTRKTYLIGTLSATTSNRKIAIDSSGNVYTNDAAQLVKYSKSLDYTQSNFYTLVANVDYIPATVEDASGTMGIEVLDYQVDSLDNMYLLIGTTTAGGNNNKFRNTSISLSKLDSSGNHVSTTFIASRYLAAQNAGSYGYVTGGLILDTGYSNFSYVYEHDAVSAGNTFGLYHRNSTESTSIATLTAITDIGGMGYNNFVLYITSPAQNLIRGYTTSFAGYVPASNLGVGTTEPAEIGYNIDTITSSFANYYNTSKIQLNVKIDADSGYNLLGSNYLVNLGLYRWRLDIIDPNGVDISQASTGACTDSWAPLNPTGRCLLTASYLYSPPAVGWLSGSWRANLYETGANNHIAYLATTTWNVYNGSTNGTSTISNPTEPITSDSNQATITLFDNYVGLLGFGINSVSKLLFSLLIVVIMFVIGMWKGSGNIGLALSTIPYTFFTYIGYIPKWVFVVYIIMLIMIAKVFR